MRADDLLVVSKFKNLLLWDFLNGRTQAAVARAAGVSPASFGKLLNLKQFPINKDGKYCKAAEIMSAYFHVTPDYLFPSSLYSLKLPGTVERTYSSEELLPLLNTRDMPLLPPPDQALEQSELKQAIDKALGTLTASEERIIKLRFGYHGPELTLLEIAQELGLSRSRVNQIEQKALRKLRHPSRSKAFREFLPEVKDAYAVCASCGHTLRWHYDEYLGCRHKIQYDIDKIDVGPQPAPSGYPATQKGRSEWGKAFNGWWQDRLDKYNSEENHCRCAPFRYPVKIKFSFVLDKAPVYAAPQPPTLPPFSKKSDSNEDSTAPEALKCLRAIQKHYGYVIVGIPNAEKVQAGEILTAGIDHTEFVAQAVVHSSALLEEWSVQLQFVSQQNPQWLKFMSLDTTNMQFWRAVFR